MSEVELLERIKALERKLKLAELREQPRWVYLTSPLTSTSWDGDARSTTAATVIDLSSVFSVPAGVKAIAVKIAAAESAAHPLTTNYFSIGPTATYSYAMALYPIGSGNIANDSGVCPCNADGDIYYAIDASGAGTITCWIEIFGYMI